MNIVDRMTITLTAMQLKGHQPRAIYLCPSDWRELRRVDPRIAHYAFMSVPVRESQARFLTTRTVAEKQSSYIYDKQGVAHTIRKWRQPVHDKKVKG